MMKGQPQLIIFTVFIFFLACSGGHEEYLEEFGPDMSKEEVLEARIRKEPNNAEPYFKRGEYYLNEGRINEAIADLEKAIRRDSSVANYHYLIARAYFENKKVGEALHSSEKAISLNEKHVGALIIKSKILFHGWRYDEAVMYADKALRADVHNAEAYFWKGMCFREIGDTLKAKSSFQTAVEQNPEYVEAYIQLGRVYGSENDSLALQYFRNALDIEPENLKAHYSIGMFYQYNEKMGLAIDAYRNMITIDSVNTDARYNIGTIYGEYMENYDSALVYFDEILLIDPNQARAISGRGFCLEKTGNIEEAIKLYKRSIEIDPKFEFPIVRLNELGV